MQCVHMHSHPVHSCMFVRMVAHAQASRLRMPRTCTHVVDRNDFELFKANLVTLGTAQSGGLIRYG